MQKLEILLLGPLEFKYGGNQLHIRRRLVRTLLAYLGYQQVMISRAELLLLFWPDESDTLGRKRLREILSKLRQELPDPDILLTNDDQVGLDQEHIYVDALDFEILNEQVIRSAQQVPQNRALSDNTHQRLIQAINLWRSPLFMAGFKPTGYIGIGPTGSRKPVMFLKIHVCFFWNVWQITRQRLAILRMLYKISAK